MNINAFYLMIGAILGAVFLFFKPLKVDLASPEELAQIELNRFVVHEVNESGVKTILAGSYAQRFADRYEVSDLNLTDRSDKHIENMTAKRGVYREPMVYLQDDVNYRRDDGIRFETDSVDYNQTSGRMSTDGAFVLKRGEDRFKGNDLVYNTKRGTISAKQIEGIYILKDSM